MREVVEMVSAGGCCWVQVTREDGAFWRHPWVRDTEEGRALMRRRYLPTALDLAQRAWAQTRDEVLAPRII